MSSSSNGPFIVGGHEDHSKCGSFGFLLEFFEEVTAFVWSIAKNDFLQTNFSEEESYLVFCGLVPPVNQKDFSRRNISLSTGQYVWT